MTERPILFSGPMVRAILDGRKTQTRRVAKVTDEWCKRGFISPMAGHAPRPIEDHAAYCPYGIQGDRLWVRETWRVGAWDEEEGLIAVDYKADNYARREWLTAFHDDDTGERFNNLWEQSSRDADDAGEETVNGSFEWKPGESPCRWRPSIHMPRWACRLTLEVTGVRVERLREINNADAIAEGCPEDRCDNLGSPETWYRLLWDSINAKRAPWESNPWVWVVEFKKC